MQNLVMSREQKRVRQEKGSDDAEKVVVAVKASKEIPKTALVWALTHVVQPGDCITLLVVVPSQSSGIFTLPLVDFCPSSLMTECWCVLLYDRLSFNVFWIVEVGCMFLIKIHFTS